VFDCGEEGGLLLGVHPLNVQVTPKRFHNKNLSGSVMYEHSCTGVHFYVIWHLIHQVGCFNKQKDRSSGLPLMQVFCVVDN